MLKDFKELPRVSDSISYLYIEFARIEQDNFSIKAVRENGEIPIPITAFCVLFLGPGTSITHQAIKICAEVGVLIVWVGQNLNYFYASGFGETRSSRNLLKQVKYFSDENLHLEVVRKMYGLRFNNMDMRDKTIAQMRGMEGTRVKTIYTTYSKSFGVSWHGRDYKKGDYTKSDMVNQALTYTNNLLYGVCKSVIISLGYNASLGFIHTGNILSFVYDLADLYKMEMTVPASFKTVSMLNKQGRTDLDYQLLRKNLYEFFNDRELLKRIPKDLEYLFNGSEIENINEDGALWDGSTEVVFGKNYGGIE